MRTATVATGIALRCGSPVFSHSGGGAVVGMILRILDLKLGRAAIVNWSMALSVGLEQVFSTQARDNFQTNLAFRGNIRLQNVIADQRANQIGSDTWQNPITSSMTAIRQTPLMTNRPELTRANVGRFRHPQAGLFTGGSHGIIAFYSLSHGDLAPAITK